MAEDSKEPAKPSGGTEVGPFRVRSAAPNAGSFTGNKQPDKNPGRPPGSLNKITRTMKDAAVAAAEELGHHDRDQWTLIASKGDPNGMKHFFIRRAAESREEPVLDMGVVE
jgi:hypothetical protein